MIDASDLRHNSSSIDLAIRSDLAARNVVLERLNASSIGACEGAGGGCGEMDFSYRVNDVEHAHSVIDAALQGQFPGVAFRIRIIG